MSKTELLWGKRVFEQFELDSFTESWESLSLKSRHSNCLQDLSFAKTWYLFYQDTYEPVISVLKSKDGNLLAMICLAWQREQRILTHAGHDNSEYFGWLAMGEVERDFIRDTILLLQEKFNLTKWVWRWISPGINPEVLMNLQQYGIYTVLEKRESPIWNLKNNQKLSKLKTDSSLKSKWKRLGRKGMLEFRVITDEQQTAWCLKQIKEQTDFRREALSNNRPFADNPQKVEFNAALQRYPGTIHVSGLFLDNRVVAFHLGICNEEKVCLGISSFDPGESKNSPGTLLMVKLAEELEKNNYNYFDLTPGTDEYKNRFANEWITVFRPTFYFTPLSASFGKLKLKIKEILKSSFAFFGLKIHQILEKIYDANVYINHLRRQSLWSSCRDLLYLGLSVNHLQIYQWKIEQKEVLNTVTNHIKVNDYAALLKYHKNHPWHTRRLLLKEALSAFNRYETLFSLVKREELSWFCWCTDPVSSVHPSFFPLKISLKTKSRVVYNFYPERDFSQDFYLNLENVLSQIPGNKDDEVQILIKGNGKLAEDFLGKWQIYFDRKITCITLFGFIKWSRS